MALRHKDLLARVKGLGLSIRSVDGEYRVTYPVGDYLALGLTHREAYDRAEQQAYYTDDRDDAYGTAISMSKHGASSRAA